MHHTTQRPRVVIIGAGFGGLYAARGLANTDVEVLLIDRNNYHTFTPLLYQVATAGLDPSEIAYPVRGIFRRNRNIRFMLGEVTEVDSQAQQVQVRTNGQVRTEDYDYLVIAAGSVTNHFGSAELAQFSHGLKDLNEAVSIRNHILRLFEKAAWENDPDAQRAMTTIAVVGGGPTGLETAGAMHELYNHVLKHEYPQGSPLEARVLLIEATDRLLAPYPQRLRDAALHQLESLGVQVMLNTRVETVGPDYITLSDGSRINTYTLIWAAGVKGAPIASMLKVPLTRGGRIPVTPQLEVIGRTRVYAVGDIAHLENPRDGQSYPQVIPVANQQGALAARNILAAIQGEDTQPFVYRDRGIMATIGRRRAVAYPFYRVQLSGWFAWVTWLGLHLLWLMGFRNRVSVFIGWVWNYLTFDRAVRIILTDKTQTDPNDMPQAAEDTVPAAEIEAR